MSRKPSVPIAVLEAAYDLDSDDTTWLTNVAQATRPFLDDGHGITAYFYDAMAGSYAPTLHLGMPAEHVRLYGLMWGSTEEINMAHRANPNPLGGAVEAAAQAGISLLDLPNFRESFEGRGISDAVALRSVEPYARGIGLVAGRAHPWHVDRRTHRLWSRVSSHLGAARRLRAVAAAARVTEAILTPAGKVEHAEGEGTSKSAREALRDAVVRQEAARASHDDDPIDAWTALVSGRWTLVDRFERGGRRYLVAHRNEVAVADPRGLTPRERVIAVLVSLGKSNKLIAYELGLSESVVGTLLSTAMKKLGVRSRVELIGLVRDTVTDVETSPPAPRET